MWEIFEKLCAERGITPYKVSKDTGITQSTLYNWKIRNNLIGVERGQKIADYFGVSLEYLMTGKDPEGYYENDETAQIAQAIHDNRELRGLFSAAKDVDERIISALHKMLLILKQTEERNENSE
jgi:transcriptional regulator with XRE-family HTH domain